ncbi:MAG: aspartyl-tRNA(Asn)/glutamyl-tRNA(Gln) amidotransferase subunit [Acidimicrobiaceae bacterium]|nr:aspartyl-tRNA(Asn)/glutamyl-tRNA(Gln) amidotransferase subunit [Acidimicrobiaceae bacterium]
MRTVIETAEGVRRGELKAVEVLDECLSAIDRRNEALNAFVHLDPDLAREAAEQVDAAVARGDDPGPLAGVPFGVKDLEDCAGMPTSHGSLLYKGRPPVDEDSVHVARLRAAGAVPVGKTAAPEFGAVAYTSTPAWGTTRNPWNPERTPGGSSGGSAAAVAAGMVPFCTASDGGGSTRIPAAFTGLYGFKASYGRIPHPRAAESQTACFGALTTTVADSARHLDVAAGPDDRDRGSLPPPTVRYEDAIEALAVEGLRACWSPDLGFATVDTDVAGITEEAAMDLVKTAGLELVDRPIRLTDPVKTWLSSGAVDLWLDLEKGMWPEREKDFDYVVRVGLRMTQDLTVPKFARTLQWRQRLEEEVAALYRDVDVVLTPATAVPAFAAEGPMPDTINGETNHPAMSVPFTMVGNLCWNPAASVPAGLSPDGLPVGLQIMARRHADDVVLRLSRIFEQLRPWPRVAPSATAVP